MNKKTLWIIISIIVIAGVVYIAKRTPKTEAPAEEEVTPATVGTELDSIDTGDVEGELKSIDTELENL